MEENHQKPTPLPRSRSPYTHQENIYSNLLTKKPVPLPRSSAITMASPSRPRVEDEKASSESSSFEEAISKGYNTLTKSLKKKLKSASGNVQEKGKAVRGILQKRTSFTNSDCKEDADDIKPTMNRCQSSVCEDGLDAVRPRVNRCQSLPTQDIFSTIKFDSPIHHEQFETTFGDSDEENSFPPPEYPPPPLPDESLYDEVSTTRSSISESHGEYYTCSSLISSLPDMNILETYEDVQDLRRLSSCNQSDSNSSQSCELTHDFKVKNNKYCGSDCGSPRSCDTQPVNEHKKVIISRSESWSFYDTVHVPTKQKGEQYVNVKINEKKGRVSHSDAEKRNSTTASEPKALKPMQPILVSESTCNSSDGKIALTRTDSVASSSSSKLSSMSIPNELYINWHPIKKRADVNDKNKKSFATKSFFSEFDPLYESLSAEGKKIAGASAESLPVYIADKHQSDEDFDTVSLPVPPRRYDSITEHSAVNIPNDVEYVLYQRPIGATPVENDAEKSNFNDYPGSNATSESTTAENSPSESPDREMIPEKRKTNLVRWSSMKNAIKKVADGSNWSPNASRKKAKSKVEDSAPVSREKDNTTPDVVERPVINSSSGPLHNGILFKSPSGGDKQKDFVQKWCQLSEGRLTFSVEKNGSNKDIIYVEHIYSIQIVRETKQSNECEDVYCMEISCSMRDKPHLVGSPGTTERRIWMQKLLESLTLVFPSRLTAEYTRAGWCYLKEGISAGWLAAWVLLHKRTFYFCSSQGKLSEIDLRKARCIVLQEDNEEGCVRVAEKGPIIRMDTPNCAYYMQMNEPRETKAWCRIVHEAAVDNGPLLHEQQLSKDDLPTIIEKCINFVYAHGSMSEGIYRRSGSNTSVSKLLTAFQKDAWAVQITRNDYTEHDVASVLKRFFRDLPEPLLTTQLHKMLCNATGLDCSEEEKVTVYRSLLEQLPPVNYVTTRRLMGHLHHIHQQCERNLMPVDNLAAIWGPTLMHVESGVDANWSRRESEVVRDLILLYPRLFHVDGAELAREQRIQEVLERYHNSSMQTPNTSKPSGDIKVWVYIGSKDSDCVSVTVSPQREALDVCNELCSKMNVYGHELSLLESVLNGALIRPLHHRERVLDTILRWGYWDDSDCKDNCLILVINTIVRDIHHLAKPPVAQCGELRFADLRSKSFKVYHFEFSQAKLCYYKDKAGSTKLGEWKIEDIVWYIGHEPKRNPHTRWSITFINKNNRSKRSKENPYFGYTIAGTTKDQQLQWMAAMMIGEFPHVDLLPKPQLNLLE